MSDKSLDEEIWDAGLHEVDTVEFKVHPSKRSDRVTLTMYDNDGGPFTLIKIYGACLKLADQIARELNLMEESERQ